MANSTTSRSQPRHAIIYNSLPHHDGKMLALFLFGLGVLLIDAGLTMFWAVGGLSVIAAMRKGMHKSKSSAFSKAQGCWGLDRARVGVMGLMTSVMLIFKEWSSIF